MIEIKKGENGFSDLSPLENSLQAPILLRPYNFSTLELYKFTLDIDIDIEINNGNYRT